MAYQFTLEPLVKLDLNKKRYQVKQCPCGKNNKDGKFVPFKGFEDRGYCHSCGLFYNVALHTCPGCRKEKAFSKYIDRENRETFSNAHVGKCLYCSYHYTPKQYFEDNKDNEQQGTPKQNLKKPEFSYIEKRAETGLIGHNKKCESSRFATNKKDLYELHPTEKMLTNVNLSTIHNAVSLIPVEVFKQSLKHHQTNNFIQFLSKHFGSEITSGLISRYFIGTSKHWSGATVFWQIDSTGKIRTGKIMLYNPNTGKRSKEQHQTPAWVHKALNLHEFSLQQCFFGEHLLQNNTKPVAICESEKTAIIASVYLPQFVWIAAGSKTGLNETKCKVLTGRNVVLFPDISKPKENQKTAFELWTNKAKEFAHLTRFTVSDLLERKAIGSEKEQGLDLADYLLRFPVQAFKPAPLHLLSTDIIALLGNSKTGKAFNNYIIQGYEFKSGNMCDVLFDANGEMIRPGEQVEAVNQLASFFNKDLQPAMLDNIPCWVHEDKQFDNL